MPEDADADADGVDAGGDGRASYLRAVHEAYDELARVHREARTAVGEPGIDQVDAVARDLPDGARVLDAGCGSGVPVLSRFDLAFDVVGLDLSREQLERAHERSPTAGLVQGDMTSLPFADDAFDGLVALHSIIHVPREAHPRVYREFHRVLADGAPALVTTGTDAYEGGTPNWLGSGVEMHWSFPAAEETLTSLRAAGFAVEEETRVPDEHGGGEFLFVRVRA
ncbi:SAM-dependent methyltransferase [Halarchaeum rubridurum]|uniref:Methyltransferase type 11 n=1 Tax=Halarchaeum rubridurum TaxID=489911 RepID=A0A830G2H2_9EURY|nr:class I SAM-dependent methyltransferase [Halarchaeum rubridurum]MBP1955312.1 SAM-dependent methyltransferase [Halarchaeum rubridurum]GGM71268.1 methyltransferase type 11 [Halarchaeum rubridurum]